MRIGFIIIAAALAASLVSAGGEPEEGHPSLLPMVATTSQFPLYEAADLAHHGYPDHQHVYFWPGWLAPLDEQGAAYGFGSFCAGLHTRDRDGFVVEAGRVAFAPFVMMFDADAEPCLVAPFLGFCEMALVDARSLLGLDPVGELTMANPSDTAAYTARTGYGTWRMSRYGNGAAVVQPVGILARRTLIAHAARDLVARWLLDVNGAGELPAWFREGLSAWFAEMGVHLCNYMAGFRIEGSVLMSPTDIDSILSSPADDDVEVDRRQYRVARYGAFLMVWQLVEHHGGLEPLRDLLTAIGNGIAPDKAFRAAYGHDLSELATLLDPQLTGEPIGVEVQPRNPGRPPRAGG